ncbi:MAG: hypothetical protein K2X80_16195 [Pseudomonadaceae bacterium]|nr:hypothetical protein [Pseudomonadaceae bacterium]
MTSIHGGYIAAKNAERGMLANAIEHFLQAGGAIELAGNTKPVISTKAVSRSVADHSKDDLLAERMRQQIALGAGASAIKVELKIGGATARRICAKYGLKIPSTRKVAVITPAIVSAQKAWRDEQRKKPLTIIRELAAAGSTVDEMATAAGVSRNSVMRWMRMYSIKRGPKMSLSA